MHSASDAHSRLLASTQDLLHGLIHVTSIPSSVCLQEPASTSSAAAAAGGSSAAGSRQKIEKMSGEVVDSNPYSRLMALQRMGIVKDYEQIRSKTVRRGWGGGLLA
jgi:ubiquitin-like modifier-activating enzyme 5